MLKICLCSDNHGDMNSINRILSDNPACDYYFHCGDSMMPPEEMEPFISVEGNNDWSYDYPKDRLLEIGGHRIYIFHGTGYTFSKNLMLDKAKSVKADIVFFGHTHSFTDQIYSNIRFINPGSTLYNRDLTSPSYARVYLMDDGKVRVERIDL
ncbi:MAG: metallophosphoesterase family protein [Erysipelotrichaceae bacterium]|nr:metallophosphoesterase family protein [Erysipelotrichaceae bacterium]